MTKIIHFFARRRFLVVFILAIVEGLIFRQFDFDNQTIRILIIVFTVLVLVPRYKTVTTQNGKKTYIKWFLLKKPILKD